MATESEGEEDVGSLTGNQHLTVDDDLREMTKKAAWSVSSCKPGNGVLLLRDDNLETYWQFRIPLALYCIFFYLSYSWVLLPTIKNPKL